MVTREVKMHDELSESDIIELNQQYIALCYLADRDSALVSVDNKAVFITKEGIESAGINCILGHYDSCDHNPPQEIVALIRELRENQPPLSIDFI